MSACRHALPALLASLLVAALVWPEAAAAQHGEAAATAPRITTVEIKGRPTDPPEQLARFLGLVPGHLFNVELRARVEAGLRALGYALPPELDVHPAPDGGVALTLTVAPARLIRHVRVRGNWPFLRAIFNEDILRRMTLRPGTRLPGPDEVDEVLTQEAARVKDYLYREGFFLGDAAVRVRETHVAQWVDLDVLIYLGPWFTLGPVVPTGNRALSRKEVSASFVHNFPPSFWSRVRIDRIFQDARKTEQRYRERGYFGARVFPEFQPSSAELKGKDHKVSLPLRISEKGRVHLHFIGNSALSERQLLEKTTFSGAGSYDETEIEETVRELHRFYQSKGRLETRITYRHQRSGERSDITFFITEGRELKVEQVDFKNESWAPPLHFNTAELGRQIVTKRFPLIGQLGLGEGGYVTPVQLEQDSDKLVAFYRSRGYLDARVRGEIARSPSAFGHVGVLGAELAAARSAHDRIYVRFYIDEGKRSAIARAEFRFVGGHTTSPETLAAIAGLTQGAPYVPEALSAGLKRIVAYYLSRGRPYATVATGDTSGDATAPASLSRWDESKSKLYLVIQVDEGQEVRFGEILVRGNFRTSRQVILRDLPFRSGDLFDAAKIEQATRNLQSHQIFNSVRVTYTPLELTPGTTPIPILVEVQERYDNYGSVEASIGYATDIGATVSLGYFWGNVFGGGGQFELRGDAAFDVFRQPASRDVHAPFYRLLGVTARYIQLHLVEPSLRGELSGFARKESTPALGEVISFGGRATVTWTQSPALRLYGRFELTASSLQGIELQRLPSRGDIGRNTVNDATTIAKFTAGVIFDKRTSLGGAKNPLLPTAGPLLAFQAAVAPIFAQRFVTLSGQAQHYQPLGRELTLIFNLRGDWGFPLSGAALPAVERFFAGGDTRTRGFDTDRLRTEIVYGAVSPTTGARSYRIIPQGGNVRLLGTAELQFPVAKLGSLTWAGALFVDAGTVFDRAGLFDVRRDLKASVGVSLIRLLTPLGPLSIDYAYPITQTIAEQQWKREPWYLHWPGRIHFNWGIPILR